MCRLAHRFAMVVVEALDIKLGHECRLNLDSDMGAMV